MKTLQTTALALLPLLFASACASKGRIREDGEEQLVGSKRAGNVTYDELVREASQKLVDFGKAASGAQGRFRLAFFGIETMGSEELRDQLPAIKDQIELVLVNDGHFTVMSGKIVDRARQESGLRSFEDLALPKYRDAFNAVMGREGAVPDYLVYGRTTTQTTDSEGGFLSRDKRERRYLLTLEMVDAKTGDIVQKGQGDQEVEYSK